MILEWLAVILICAFLEVITVNLVTIWFIASGIVALIASIFIDSLLIQFAIFVLLGIFLLVTVQMV